jgi:hypothetical protein
MVPLENSDRVLAINSDKQDGALVCNATHTISEGMNRRDVSRSTRGELSISNAPDQSGDRQIRARRHLGPLSSRRDAQLLNVIRIKLGQRPAHIAWQLVPRDPMSAEKQFLSDRVLGLIVQVSSQNYRLMLPSIMVIFLLVKFASQKVGDDFCFGR